MQPTSWLAAFLFVILIAPGLIFELLSQRRRAGVSESVFREVSRVALFGLLFSGSILMVLAFLRAVFAPRWLPDPGLFVRDGARYAAANYQILAGTFAIGAMLAMLLPVLVHVILRKFAKNGSRITQQSAWTLAFRRDCPPNHHPYARVRLDNGVTYAGRVQDFTADLEMEDRELVLRPPGLQVKPSGGGKLVDMPVEYERVVVSGKSIASITICYLPKNISRSAGEVVEAPSRDRPDVRVGVAAQLDA